MYQAEFPVRPGIGSEIGSDARTPSMARQPEMTNRAIFGARNGMECSQSYAACMSYDGKSLLSGVIMGGNKISSLLLNS
jgi:hypothetical protein